MIGAGATLIGAGATLIGVGATLIGAGATLIGAGATLIGSRRHCSGSRLAGGSARLGLRKGLVFGISQCLLPLIGGLRLGLCLIRQGLERGSVTLLGLGQRLL